MRERELERGTYRYRVFLGLVWKVLPVREITELAMKWAEVGW